MAMENSVEFKAADKPFFVVTNNNETILMAPGASIKTQDLDLAGLEVRIDNTSGSADAFWRVLRYQDVKGNTQINSRICAAFTNNPLVNKQAVKIMKATILQDGFFFSLVDPMVEHGGEFMAPELVWIDKDDIVNSDGAVRLEVIQHRCSGASRHFSFSMTQFGISFTKHLPGMYQKSFISFDKKTPDGRYYIVDVENYYD